MKKITQKLGIMAVAFALAIGQAPAAYADAPENTDIITENINEIISDNDTDTDKSVIETNLQTEESTITTKSAITLTDISKHWAKDKILQAVQMGFVGGYPDNTFKPDNTITRAEFAKLLNSALELKKTTEINLKDVATKDWYYTEVQKSLAAGIFSGYNDNTFKPQNPITRQEVAKVISSVITTGDTDGTGATGMSDYASIQSWAKPSVNLAANKGYLKGYPNGTFMPAKALTRAEAVKIIIDVLDNENIERDFKITDNGELYRGAVVIGTLTVTESVGAGKVKINDVTVVGDIIIKGKSISAVDMTNVKAKNLIIENDSCSVTLNLGDNVNIDSANLTKATTVVKNGMDIDIKNTVFR